MDRPALDRMTVEFDDRIPGLTTNYDVPLIAVVPVWMLARSTSQDSLFVSSIFPTATPWLGLVLVCPAAVLLVSATTPKTGSQFRGSDRTPNERRSHEHFDSPTSVS
jgi:hypothetical protein